MSEGAPLKYCDPTILRLSGKVLPKARNSYLLRPVSLLSTSVGIRSMLNKWVQKAKAGLGLASSRHHHQPQPEPEPQPRETRAPGSAPSPPPCPQARWSADNGNQRPKPIHASRGYRSGDHPQRRTPQSADDANEELHERRRRRSTSDVPGTLQSRHPVRGNPRGLTGLEGG